MGTLLETRNINARQNTAFSTTIVPPTGYRLAHIHIVDSTGIETEIDVPQVQELSYLLSLPLPPTLIDACVLLNQYTITVTVNTGGTTNKTGANAVPYNTNFTFTVSPQGGYEIDTVIPSSGTAFTITNRTGQTFTVNNVVANMSIAVSFRLIPVVLPFYIDIRNNLQIQANNDVSALVGTVPSARSRQTLIAANGGVKFRINYNQNHLQVLSDFNSFYAGLAQGTNVPSTVTDIDYLFSILHRIYRTIPQDGNNVWSQIYRTADENNSITFLRQEMRYIDNIPNYIEYNYATGSTYEIFITSSNDVQFKVNNVVIYTSPTKAYPSAVNPFYLDLLVRATDNIGAAGSISNIELLGNWTA